MKTKYCDQDCKAVNYTMHTAICLSKRRDAGEFDEFEKLKKAFKKLEKKVNALEKELEELYERTRPTPYNCEGKAFC